MVNDCIASGLMPLDAVSVTTTLLPPSLLAGVPMSSPVPALNVSQAGRVPALKLGAGVPDATAVY
jgi:hypothetical protein